MKRINKEPIILNTENEVAIATDYNAAACGAGFNQVVVAVGLYAIASITGFKSIAIATGQNSVASALKKNNLAIAWGSGAKVKGVLNSFIAAAGINADGNFDVQLKKVDGVSIMPDTWYSLSELTKIE